MEPLIQMQPQQPNLGGLQSNPFNIGTAMGGAGIKSLAQSFLSAIVMGLRYVSPVFGQDAGAYNDIVSAIKKLEKIAGSAKPSDILSAIQTFVSGLPPNMQGKSPLEGLLGGQPSGPRALPGLQGPAGPGAPQGTGAPNANLASLLQGGM